MIERFYIDAPLSLDTQVFLDETEHHHIRVLRLKEEDIVELVNGKGTVAEAEITAISQSKTTLQIRAALHHPLPPTLIHSVIPLMRPSKLEWVIEKGTEIGADSFHLFNAELSEKDSLSPHQLDRLRAIAISALKQSRRLYLPSFSLHNHLSLLLKNEALFLFGDPTGAPFKKPDASALFFITGPEKGFSLPERTLLTERAQGTKLNKNILRAETAPLVALTLLTQ